MPAARVLHIIGQLSVGGGSRAALTVAKYSARSGPWRHSLLSLLPASGAGAALALQAGVELLDAPEPEALRTAMAEADVVQLHFWNTPELYGLLRSAWPGSRLIVWLHIGGDSLPQVVTAQVAAFGDVVVAGSSYTADLPALRAPGAAPAAVITATTDLERLAGLVPEPHVEFNVGYIGSVDFEKMHPDFVALHAAIEAPARFAVGGPGGAYRQLRRQAEAAGVAARFDFHGYLADVRPVLARLDVFGYPLRRDNYSGAELVLQEAMFAGVPPVVLPYGGAARTVRDGVTGIVAPDAAGYRAAIKRLFREPQERARLGRNGHEDVMRRFRPETAATEFNALYAELLRGPKRERAWAGTARGGADQFIESLGGLGGDFETSRHSASEDECLAAEERIANASPLVGSPTSGGVLHYRRWSPNDAYLRLWAGLVLNAQGRPALAVAEFAQAARLGLDHWRVSWYQAQAAEACGAVDRARAETATVLAAAPNFTAAQELAQRLVRRRSGST